MTSNDTAAGGAPPPRSSPSLRPNLSDDPLLRPPSPSFLMPSPSPTSQEPSKRPRRQQGSSHLPSPSPSPSRSRSHSQSQSQSQSPDSHPAEESQDGLFTRFLIAPLTFLSFLLSLALIDRCNRVSRASLHAASPLPRSFLGRIGSALRSLWATEEPYASQRAAAGGAGAGPRRNAAQATAVGEKEGGSAEKKRDEVREGGQKDVWTWKTKHRRMMRLEISEALEVRQRVVVGLLVGLVAVVVAVAVMARWAWGTWGKGWAVNVGAWR
ncbi:MAG: hypothetical protein M1837_007124 [Sclerophora amabilis]|nr:MAG: hypothetical protein M1837_007124 [Sclerophora amabilis]